MYWRSSWQNLRRQNITPTPETGVTDIYGSEDINSDKCSSSDKMGEKSNKVI